MKNEHEMDEQVVFQIKVKGHLSPGWPDRFRGVSVIYEPGDILTLTCMVPNDQALGDLLSKIHETGLQLLAVSCLSSKNLPWAY